MTMTKIGVAVATLVLGAGGIAVASVPGWARTWRTTKVDVPGCASILGSAIQSVTGKVPVTSQLDANTVEVRGFTTNEGIFGYCTAATTKVCGAPGADLTILAFSSNGSGNAAAVRDKVSTKFGDPRPFDCGPVLNPVSN
jgi:hypothetical protein